MSVKRLLVVFRTRLNHKLTGFTYLDMRTAVQHRYDDVEYDHTGATLLTKRQAASLLRQVAATVQILISSRCDVLNRISSPVLRVLTCTDSSAEDPLSHYVVQSCPISSLWVTWIRKGCGSGHEITAARRSSLSS